MLLNDLNLKALNVSAFSELPKIKNINIEGYEIEFKITAFQSSFGSGKKTVISGTARRVDNNTTIEYENADVEKLRRGISKLCELTQSGRSSGRKSRAPKDSTKVDELKKTLAVVRRVRSSSCWLEIDTKKLRAAFKVARKEDRERAKEALKERAVSPLLAKIEKLSPEERALLIASLQ